MSFLSGKVLTHHIGFCVQPRGLVNEGRVELFAPAHVVGALLRSELHVMGQPRRRQGRQAPDRRPGERGKSGKVCWVHHVVTPWLSGVQSAPSRGGRPYWQRKVRKLR